MYVKSGNDVIYIKQILNFQRIQTKQMRYDLKITYITGFEQAGEITKSILSDVHKDCIKKILNKIETVDNLDTMYIDVGRRCDFAQNTSKKT